MAAEARQELAAASGSAEAGRVGAAYGAAAQRRVRRQGVRWMSGPDPAVGAGARLSCRPTPPGASVAGRSARRRSGVAGRRRGGRFRGRSVRWCRRARSGPGGFQALIGVVMASRCRALGGRWSRSRRDSWPRRGRWRWRAIRRRQSSAGPRPGPARWRTGSLPPGGRRRAGPGRRRRQAVEAAEAQPAGVGGGGRAASGPAGRARGGDPLESASEARRQRVTRARPDDHQLAPPGAASRPASRRAIARWKGAHRPRRWQRAQVIDQPASGGQQVVGERRRAIGRSWVDYAGRPSQPGRRVRCLRVFRSTGAPHARHPCTKNSNPPSRFSTASCCM